MVSYSFTERAFPVGLLFLSIALAAAQTPDQTQQGTATLDTGEQHATEQLRAIVEAIRSCPPFQLPPGVDSLEADGFVTTDGPPLNVVWNVELHPSIRGRYAGSIEFIEPFSLKPPPEDVICSKSKGHVAYCKHSWEIGMQLYSQQVRHPRQFRYEFDVTSHGLMFLRAFKKTNQTDDEPWVAGSLEGCAGNMVTKTLNQADGHVQTPTQEISPSVRESRPEAIPEWLWDSARQGQAASQFFVGVLYETGKAVPQDNSEAARWYRKAANQGNADAQFDLGNFYNKGLGVPQDYAEAYFWLDLAASGKLEMSKMEDVTKLRDDAASHLTNAVLLQTQERARKWFEEHPANDTDKPHPQ